MRRPPQYWVRVQLPKGEAFLRINRAYCDLADPPLAAWIGCSAAWISGRLKYEGLQASICGEVRPE